MEMKFADSWAQAPLIRWVDPRKSRLTAWLERMSPAVGRSTILDYAVLIHNKGLS
jgi:hypothetical protein